MDVDFFITGVSVKVVQVAKGGSSLTSPSLFNYNKAPVVVVPSSAKTPPSALNHNRVLSFNNNNNSNSSATTSSHPILKTSMSAPSLNPVVTPHAHLAPAKMSTSKSSMPLATGFKMIAVTTVVPGTTQVKTVYIATPIMSLTKNVTNSCSSVITTPALVGGNKQSSITSNLQAKSMNAALLTQVDP